LYLYSEIIVKIIIPNIFNVVFKGLIWFVVGNMWLFGDDENSCKHPERSPVYSLCISMLIINYIQVFAYDQNEANVFLTNSFSHILFLTDMFALYYSGDIDTNILFLHAVLDSYTSSIAKSSIECGGSYAIT
jgi:hypothetical protein